MKKRILIILSVILLIVLSASVFCFISRKENRLVLKCVYTTSVLDVNNLKTYELGVSEDLLFINTKKMTINNQDWQPLKNFDVYIDKNVIEFAYGKNLTRIDRVLGNYLDTREINDNLYTSTGKCDEYRYKQKF